MIAQEADKLPADLIVMGSRGLTALKGLIMGSVTTGVLARTKCPVLLGSAARKRRSRTLSASVSLLTVPSTAWLLSITC